jgi:ESX secretion system protein EccC
MDQFAPRGGAALSGSAGFRLHRRPRDHPAPVPAGEIVVAAPPRVAQAASQGWPLLLPLLSGAGSLPLLLGSPSSGRRWLLLGTAASLLLSTGAGLGLRLLARRGTEHARRRERARYLDHLQAVGTEVARLAALQRAAVRRLHPDLNGLLSVVELGGRVWERSATDDDFLEVRFGIGEVPLGAPVRLDLGHDPLADHEPELLAQARDLVERSTRLHGLPVTVRLGRGGVVAVHGPPQAARSLIRAILLRAAVFHGPPDLGIVGLSPPDAAAAWEWLKWLPHARELSFAEMTRAPECRLAVTTNRSADLLERVVGPRLANGKARGGDAHLIVVVDGYTPDGTLGRLAVLDALLRSAPAVGATVICLVARATDEPSATRLRVVLNGRGGVDATDLAAGGRWIRRGRADRATLAVSEAIARRLAPLWVDAPAEAGAGEVEPNDTRLLDVLGLADLPAAGDGGAWPALPEGGFLRAPIGQPIGTRSSRAPVVLDLKEAAGGGMGPHGLLVGATGSGKSELLRTLVAGLALTHPPELLSLILVDFKGGAAFAGLAGLPHTAGLITNLQSEPGMVGRARAALWGELERRQRLLRDAGDLDSIDRYQRMRSADPSLEPLPRLLIVVDEFGELLAGHPDFLDLFTAIGRTGRSLGIHLLLASQRLEAGRLRGLDSHLRYRICLRTFSPADSAAVLGTADAYFLPSAPGHGLLKVDSDPCQRFKGLLVSRPTRAGTMARERRAPALPLVLPFDPLIEPARSLGSDGESERSTPWSDASGGRVSPAPVQCSDLDTVVGAMTPLARTGRRTHRIWLPPLAATIPLDQVLKPGGSPRSPGDPDWLRVPIGIVDRPYDQSQRPLVHDFTGRSGHLAIAGAPRSGKSTLLATLIASFALTHPPDAVQFYCVDLGGGLLHELADLPHVGTVLSAREPNEVRRLVRELLTVVAEREEGFRRDGVASISAWHQRRAAAPPDERDGYGEVFLVIDDWSRFRQEFSQLEPAIEEMAGRGLHHGVHLIVAANRWPDLRLALRDNLGGRLELRLNDPIESEIDRAAATRLPDRLPGRGLTCDGGEFQTAVPVIHSVHDRAAVSGHQAVTPRAIADRAVRSPTGAAAPLLRPLPTLVPLEGLLIEAVDPTGPAGGPAGSTERLTRPIQGPPGPAADPAGPTNLAVAATGASPGPAPGPPGGPAGPTGDSRGPAGEPAGPGEPARSGEPAGLAEAPAGPGGTPAAPDGLRSAPPGVLGPVPIGLHDHRLELVRLDLGSAPHFLVFGDPESGKTATLRCIATALMARHAPAELRVTVVDFRRGLAGLARAPHCGAYASTATAAAAAADRLRSIFEGRMAGTTGQPPPPGRPWSRAGPRHLLIIDDYDLVAAGRNPLDPILGLVAQGRDLGFHVLLARPVNGAARSSFEPFYQRVRESGSAGLILSGDPREGPLLGGRTATPQPSGRGHLVTRHGRSGLIQIAWVPVAPARSATSARPEPGDPGIPSPPTWPGRVTPGFAAPGPP